MSESRVNALSSGLKYTGDDALKELIASGDTSVPGIEPSDLNDGDILANTRERVNDQGQMQFVYIPPDGSDHISSDWIQQEHKKKVILGWCEGVKNAIISRGQAGMQEANQARLEEKLRKKREEDMADVEDTQTVATAKSVEVGLPQPTISTRNVPQRNTAPASSDPAEYVGDQLAITRERLAAAEQAQQDILREVMSARRDYDKWKALAAALGADDSDDSGDSIGAAVVSQAPAGTTSRILSVSTSNSAGIPAVRTDRQVRVQR